MSHSFDLSAHFGLGTAQTADVTVRWPSGRVDTLPGVGRRQTVTIVEGVGRNEPPSRFSLSTPADGSAAGQPATVAWVPATDAEGDAVTYTVILSGPDGDQELSAGTGSALALPALAEGTYRWAVVAHDAYGVRTSLDPFTFNIGAVASEGAPRPQALSLLVSPNPSAGNTTVAVTAPPGATVRVVAYDVLGRMVEVIHPAALDGARLSLGSHQWPPGIYTVQASDGKTVAVTRLTVTL